MGDRVNHFKVSTGIAIPGERGFNPAVHALVRPKRSLPSDSSALARNDEYAIDILGFI
jgi:hypothetical protein